MADSAESARGIGHFKIATFGCLSGIYQYENQEQPPSSPLERKLLISGMESCAQLSRAVPSLHTPSSGRYSSLKLLWQPQSEAAWGGTVVPNT